MQCIVVNGATLKTDACCAHCSGRIGEAYVRAIDTRLLYCDFRCYSIAIEVVAIATYRAPAVHAWRPGS
jgi:hypothetical protein